MAIFTVEKLKEVLDREYVELIQLFEQKRKKSFNNKERIILDLCIDHTKNNSKMLQEIEEMLDQTSKEVVDTKEIEMIYKVSAQTLIKEAANLASVVQKYLLVKSTDLNTNPITMLILDAAPVIVKEIAEEYTKIVKEGEDLTC